MIRDGAIGKWKDVHVGGKRKIPAPITWEELDRYSSVSVCCTGIHGR